MNNDKTRAAFEATYPGNDLERRERDDGYQNGRTADMWHAWKTGRAALTVEQEYISWSAPKAHSQPSADDARVPDLSRLVARLMRELKKADPAHELPMKAMDYLTRHDLIGSPLRADGPLIDEATRAPDAEVIAELLAALRCALCMMNDECYSDEYTVEFAKVRAAIAHAEGRAA